MKVQICPVTRCSHSHSFATQDSVLQVPPSVFQAGQDTGTGDRLRFWDAPETLDFFEDHGYTLYTRVFSEEGDVTCSSRPLFVSEGFVDKRHPYASYDYASDVDSVLLASDSRVRAVPLSLP